MGHRALEAIIKASDDDRATLAATLAGITKKVEDLQFAKLKASLKKPNETY